MSRFLLVLLSVCVLAECTASAQTTFATLTGTVTDPNGAVIPGATVEAINQASNYRYSAKSNDAGYYTVGQMLQGVYTIRVRSTGFKESVVQQIQLVSLDVRRLDIQLEIGAVETHVEVSASTAAIET